MMVMALCACMDGTPTRESERLGQVEELLKSYQDEIDSLTRRAK
jgi:hypothetical protein